MEDDPQERQMQAQCQAQVNRIKDENDKLAADHAQTQREQQALIKAEEDLVGEEARMALILAELKGSIKDAQTELADADQQTADLVAKIVEAQIERQDQLIAAANEAT